MLRWRSQAPPRPQCIRKGQCQREAQGSPALPGRLPPSPPGPCGQPLGFATSEVGWEAVLARVSSYFSNPAARRALGSVEANSLIEKSTAFHFLNSRSLGKNEKYVPTLGQEGRGFVMESPGLPLPPRQNPQAILS